MDEPDGLDGTRARQSRLPTRRDVLRAGVALVPLASTVATENAAAATTVGDFQPQFPIRAAFYYPWFPEAWNQQGYNPFTEYHPTLGYYDSGSPAVIARHIDDMTYGHIAVGISSWWGQGTPTDARFPLLLRAARDTHFRWAIYYEPEGYSNPSIEQIEADLEYIKRNYGADDSYLRIDGRFVVFVYNADDADCSVSDRWAQANTVGAHLVLKVFGGYRDCPSQPDGWHQYGPAVAEDSQAPYSFTISPGFFKMGESTARLPRDPVRWQSDIQAMLRSGARFQLITTFNEWGEGTAIEDAEEWSTRSGYGTYLDALHRAPVR